MHNPHHDAHERNRRRHERAEAEGFLAAALAAPEGSSKQQYYLLQAELLEWSSQQ